MVDLGDLNNVPVEDFCVVASFLTTSVIHFQAIKAALTNPWHPHSGVTIFDWGDKRFLFRFYYEIDFDIFFEGSPWTFNGHLLVFHRLHKGDDPFMVSLIFTDF
ncbi:hypothetical protein GOBAR_AA04764 [Gossypium barbadense]|uniref:DUF4283 domain-containing protein n=1 Tax=Gossypium barbadense TaxID=3634 RepID=A0A2P5YJQ2_GOSBA|nr:hypothetical protein GOBAR_AA04764 [Gossypium barbadense]